MQNSAYLDQEIQVNILALRCLAARFANVRLLKINTLRRVNRKVSAVYQTAGRNAIEATAGQSTIIHGHPISLKMSPSLRILIVFLAGIMRRPIQFFGYNVANASYIAAYCSKYTGSRLCFQHAVHSMVEQANCPERSVNGWMDGSASSLL